MITFRLRITGDLGFEFWQDIPGYEGIYQASTYGRIKSLGQTVHRGSGNGYFFKMPERILKSFYNTTRGGYEGVVLSKDGKHFTLKVHRLIAETFLSKSSLDQNDVNHKNECKTENRVENLEWCTRRYNLLYLDGIKRRMASRKPYDESRKKQVLQYSLNGMLLNEYSSVTDACCGNKYGASGIISCCKNRCKTYKGYIWKYKEGS